MGLVWKDDGWRIPDWLWEQMETLLPAAPAHPLGCHRPRVPDRDAMNAIFMVLRTGMQWNALNATGICSSSSAYRRFQEWEAAGVFHELWRKGLLAYDEVVGIDWDWLAADGAMSKAPLGGPKTGPNPRRPQLHGAHPHPRRGDRAQAAQPRLARPAVGRRSLPLVAKPQPRDPHPLVKKGGKPPRSTTARKRPDRAQESSRRDARSHPTGIGPKRVPARRIIFDLDEQRDQLGGGRSNMG